jgi:hypothetical protein
MIFGKFDDRVHVTMSDKQGEKPPRREQAVGEG